MMIFSQESIAKPDQQLTTDMLLQTSRRIDWRFLLPDPELLRRVAYIGPARGPLVESLQLFSLSLTIIDTPRVRSEDISRFDVVVVREPSYKILERAAKLVRPGGFLYNEVYGLIEVARRRRIGQWLRASSPKLRYPADYVAAIVELGFSETQVHWHWPNFEACTKMIPLDRQEALHYAITSNGNSLRARLESALGRWWLWSGLLPKFAPCFSVVAQRDVE